MTDLAELIQTDHARISRMIGQLTSAIAQPNPAKAAPEAGPMWALLAGFLRLHIAAAGEVAYLALASTCPEADLAITQASEADADICEAMAEARLQHTGSRVWTMAVQAACRGTRAHITCVESGPLLQYQRQTAPAIRRAMGRQWVIFVTARVLDGDAP